MATKTLPAGSVVHIHGIPVELTKDTEISFHPENAKLIERDEAPEGSIQIA